MKWFEWYTEIDIEIFSFVVFLEESIEKFTHKNKERK